MHEDKIGRIIRIMLDEGKRREAPVFRISEIAKTPFRNLVFTILSARTKDDTTILAAKKLLSKAPSAKKLKSMTTDEIEECIYGVGFHRQKAKNLKKTAEIIVERGAVPDNLEELTSLPGVGRKTANIVLATSFGKDAIGVDTHVHRISNRLGIVKTKTPEKTEEELQESLPRRYWKKINLAMVAYGQTVCTPRNPACEECRITMECPKIGVKKE
jgi:endonuclease-3